MFKKIELVEKKSKKTGNKYFVFRVVFEYEGKEMYKDYPFFENDLYLSNLYKQSAYKEI